MEEKKIYVVHEETYINGERDYAIVATSFDKEKAKEAMKKHFESYQDLTHIFDFSDEGDSLVIETNDDDMYIKDLISEDYAFLTVLGKEVI